MRVFAKQMIGDIYMILILQHYILMTHIVDHPPLAVGETDERISKLENERVNTPDLPQSNYGKFWPKNLIKLVTTRYKS